MTKQHQSKSKIALTIIIFMLVVSICALTGCSNGESVTHKCEILDKRIVYSQTAQVKIGSIISAPSTVTSYKFDLRDENGQVVTKTVNKQVYYDFEIGDFYTYESNS